MAERAHREQSTFLDMAHLADYVQRGGKNDPSSSEYVDLADDLEGPTPMWDCFKPGGALYEANDYSGTADPGGTTGAPADTDKPAPPAG